MLVDLPILLHLTLDAIENFISLIRRAIAYLDEIFLSAILSITVFPMAMCFYEVWLLLALPVLLDGSILQLKIETLDIWEE